MKAFTLRDLPQNERPRERAVKYGIHNVSSQELLALILGRGVSGESVMVMSQKILSTFKTLKNIMNASLQDLQKIHGIGLAKATQLQACFELSKRANIQIEKQNIKITKSHVAYELLKDDFKTYKKEYFVVMSLDTRNNFIAHDIVSIGTLNASLVHPREVFDRAVYRNAAQIILFHNHPSGDPDPSDEDITITKRLISAGRIMGIDVIDHIVIGDECYMSFKEKNLI